MTNRISTVTTMRPLLQAGLIIVATAGIGYGVGYISLNGIPSQAPTQAFATDFWGAFLGIVRHNLPTSLLLYSGVISLAFGAVLGTFMLATYVGATMAAAVTNGGWGAVLESIAWYAPAEFAGFLIAAIAGTLPLLAARRESTWRARVTAYGDATALSLRYLGVALLVLLAAALIESVVIISRIGI